MTAQPVHAAAAARPAYGPQQVYVAPNEQDVQDRIGEIRRTLANYNAMLTAMNQATADMMGLPYVQAGVEAFANTVAAEAYANIGVANPDAHQLLHERIQQRWQGLFETVYAGATGLPVSGELGAQVQTTSRGLAEGSVTAMNAFATQQRDRGGIEFRTRVFAPATTQLLAVLGEARQAEQAGLIPQDPPPVQLPAAKQALFDVLDAQVSVKDAARLHGVKARHLQHNLTSTVKVVLDDGRDDSIRVTNTEFRALKLMLDGRGLSDRAVALETGLSDAHVGQLRAQHITTAASDLRIRAERTELLLATFSAHRGEMPNRDVIKAVKAALIEEKGPTTRRAANQEIAERLVQQIRHEALGDRPLHQVPGEDYSPPPPLTPTVETEATVTLTAPQPGEAEAQAATTATVTLPAPGETPPVVENAAPERNGAWARFTTMVSGWFGGGRRNNETPLEATTPQAPEVQTTEVTRVAGESESNPPSTGS